MWIVWITVFVAVVAGVIVAAIAIRRKRRPLAVVLLGLGATVSTLLLAFGLFNFWWLLFPTPGQEGSDVQYICGFGGAGLVLGAGGLALCVSRLRRWPA
jgi:MFS family permease